MEITRQNIGKIAERIVMNELEARGYRATDLNKDGLSANADLLVAKNGKVWQIQVKGASNKLDERWWVQYGYCNEEHINGRKKFFNSKDSFYKAQYVALVAVKSPQSYRCFILPLAQAEKMAQLNLDGYYRKPGRRYGRRLRPGKMWRDIERPEKARTKAQVHEVKERKIIKRYEDCWDLK